MTMAHCMKWRCIGFSKKRPGLRPGNTTLVCGMCVTWTSPKFYFLPTVIRTCTKHTEAESFGIRLLKKCPAFSGTARLIAYSQEHVTGPPPPFQELDESISRSISVKIHLHIFFSSACGLSFSRNIPAFMVLKINCREWPCWQEYATGSSPDPDEPISLCISIKIHLNVVFWSIPLSSESIKHTLTLIRLLIWMHEKNTPILHVQVFLRLDTWFFETRRRQYYWIKSLMKKVCILLVLITYVYHNVHFKKRKVFQEVSFL